MRNSFNPDELTLLAKVIDEACHKLGYVDGEVKESLAARVLAYAAQGERDFATLLAVALGGKAIADAP